MTTTTSRIPRQVTCIAFAMACALVVSLHAATIVTYTWTGGGAAGVWTDTANWSSTTSLYPGNNAVQYGTDIAVFPNGFGPTFTSMPATVQLYGLTTGNTKVTFSGGVQVDRSYDNTGTGSMSIGTGGVQGTTILAAAGGNGVATLAVAGDVKANVFGSNFAAPTLSGSPTFDVKTFYLPSNQGSGTYNIPAAWNFLNVDTNGLTFTHNSIIQNMTFNWTGTPNFNGGRPSYVFTKGAKATHTLNAQTLIGNSLQLDGWPGDPANRYAILTASGGTLDLNTIGIAFGNGGCTNSYVSIPNSTLSLRGSGIAWDNRSTNNTLFDVRTNTTTTLDPAAGALSISTGSKDRGGDGVQPADWLNNFAFWNIALGTGDVITLTGNATIEGLGTSALYAHYLSGSGTIALNGHNVYLDEYPASTVLFTGTGTVYAIPEPGALALLGLAGLVGLARRRSSTHGR